jgi:hypothetical protein
MAKQRGGSPFTDSWFEMPFWFLLFLIIITVILLWQFGIFNKPVPPAIAKIIPGVQQQGILTIVEAIQSEDALSAQVTYFTKDAPHGAKVMFRIVDMMAPRQYSEFHTSEKPETVHVSAGIGNPRTNQSIEGYLSLNDTPITPVESVPVRIMQ